MIGRKGMLNLVSGGPITAKTVLETCKSVWKSAIELIYWDHGSSAFNPLLDDARAAVIASGGPAWAVLPKHSEAAESFSLKYQLGHVDDRPSIPVFVSVFGFELYTDLMRRDLVREDIEPPFEANIWVADEGRR